MDKTQTDSFIRVTDNKIVNEKAITWVRKMDECIYICTSSNGCNMGATHIVCNYKYPEDYTKLNEKWFS